MAYIFKTFLRAENKEFIFCQNKANSIKSTILSLDKEGKTKTVATVNNKTNEIVWEDYLKSLKEQTAEKLKTKLNLILKN